MADKKPWERDYGSQPSGTTFQTDPYGPAEQRRAEEANRRAQESLDLQRANAARNAENDALDRAEKAEKLAEQRAERERLERAQRSGMSDALYQLRTTINTAREAQLLAADGSGIGSYEGTEAFMEGGPGGIYGMLGVNEDALDMRGLLNTVASNTALDKLMALKAASPTGGALGAVSEKELALLRDSIASLEQTQSDEQFKRNLQKVIDSYTRIAAKLDSAQRYEAANGTMEGYTPPSEEELLNFRFPGDPSLGGNDDPTAAGAGAESTLIEVPEEMQAEYAAYIKDNWGRHDPRALADFMAGLEMKYNRPVGVPDYGAFVERMNTAASEGAPSTVVGKIPATDRSLSEGEQRLNDFVSSPFGTAVTSYANSAGFGVPELLSGNKMDAAAELNPKSAFFGDIAGGFTGAGLSAGALRKAGVDNPFIADLAYGTIHGANTSDDMLTGALGGATATVIGDQAGKYLGRGWANFRSPDDPLTAGQRAVAGVAGEDVDEIAAALARAEELGVPMTLADTNPRMMSLAGVSTRFSPDVAGEARDLFYQRGAGQYDRLVDAVERDLGPVSNIPQRSEDLMQQARTNAGPLYDQAYSAPGAEMVDLSSLAGRPTFDKALREAYTEVLDEGGDPSAMGLELVGEDVLLGAPSWQALDYAKRGLDNIIERGIRQGDMPEVRRAQMMKQSLVSQMDELNPAYGQARQAYAGPAAERGMLERGTEAYRAAPDQLAVDMANLTPEQAAQMRLGFQSEAVNRAAALSDSTNPWNRLSSPQMRQRLDVLYDGAEDADIARLIEQTAMERQLAGNASQISGNSATAGREIADQYFQAVGAQGGAGETTNAIFETALNGGPWITVGKGITDRLLRDRREAAAMLRNQELADEIGPLLLSQGTQAATDLQRMTAENADYQAIVEALLESGEGYGRRLGTAVGVSGANAYSY